MSHKVTSFLLALILFFAAIAAVSVEAHSCKSKRDNSPLAKRNNQNSKQCPCAVAQAVFGKTVNGITVYAQNECGQTTITGYLTGLVNPDQNRYAFLIEACGNIIANLTDVLNATIAADGTTQFTALDKDLNLNCDKDGILNIVCGSNSSSYYKRASNSNMQISQNGGSYASAPIGGI